MAGINTNTNLMLHLNGADASTTITDDSGKGHSLTARGNAQLDTAYKQWGTASLLLDGDGDYVDSADSADWDFVGSASTSWTIDFWVKHADHAGSEQYICQYEDGSNNWQLHHVHGSGIEMYGLSGGNYVWLTGYGGEITDTNWHHIALIRVGTKYAVYKDGVQVNYVDDATTDTFAGSLYIGSQTTTDYFAGSIDELRIQKSNIFSANPNVGKTDTITVPLAEYSLDAVAYSETYTDVVTVVDTISRSEIRVLTDVATIVDTAVKSTARIVSDVVTIVEAIPRSIQRSISDVITMVDSISNQAGKIITDVITIVDTKGAVMVGKVVTDVITIVETIPKSIQRSVSDVIIFIDSISNEAGKILTDTISIADSIIRSTERVVEDTITIADSLIKSIEKVISDSISISDTITKILDLIGKLPSYISALVSPKPVGFMNDKDKPGIGVAHEIDKPERA